MDKSSFYHLRVNRRQHRSYIISLFLTISVSQYCKLLESFPAEQLFAQTCLCYNSSGMFCLHMQLPSPAREKPRARPWLHQLMQEGDGGRGKSFLGNVHKQIVGKCKCQARLRTFTPAPRCKISNLQEGSASGTKGTLSNNAISALR